MNKIKLFCFAYAGGSVALFKDWKDYLAPHIELLPVEIAGRGKRMNEPLYKDMTAAIDDVSAIVKREIKAGPYALFGHSFGSRIAYHLAQRLATDKEVPPPQHLFFSGSGAPHIVRADKKKYALMDDGEFKNAVFDLGGTPQEFFDHPELMELFLPILKNDFRLSDAAAVPMPVRPLDTDISVLIGKEDDLSPEQVSGWEMHTSKTYRSCVFDGGHFFLHAAKPDIIALINATLAEVPASRVRAY